MIDALRGKKRIRNSHKLTVLKLEYPRTAPNLYELQKMLNEIDPRVPDYAVFTRNDGGWEFQWETEE